MTCVPKRSSRPGADWGYAPGGWSPHPVGHICLGGYGIEKATGAPGEHLPWSQVSEWLTSARNYWVCSTRPDGRPHVKPVWGIWLEGQLLFSTHPETITARNLRANPALAVHLESGDQVVIVEGGATKLDDRSLLARFGEAYEAKYDWPLSPEDLDPGNPDAAFYAVRPRVALSWDTAAEIGETITRWNFDRSTEFNRTFGRQC